MEEKTKQCPACGGDVSDRRRLGMQEGGVWYRCVDWFHDKAQQVVTGDSPTDAAKARLDELQLMPRATKDTYINQYVEQRIAELSDMLPSSFEPPSHPDDEGKPGILHLPDDQQEALFTKAVEESVKIQQAVMASVLADEVEEIQRSIDAAIARAKAWQL